AWTFDRGKPPQAAAAGNSSFGAHPPRQWAQSAIPQSGTYGIDRRDGRSGGVDTDRRSHEARDTTEIRVPSPMAPWRLGAVGQPQRHAPGQSRLRHERTPLSLPPHAQGRSASMIAAASYF